VVSTEMEQLLAMGFPEHQALKALKECANADAAISFIFENSDKDDAWWLENMDDEPAPETAPGGSVPDVPLPLAGIGGGGGGAWAVEAELPAVLGSLPSVADAREDALADPAFLREALQDMAGVDAESVVRTLLPGAAVAAPSLGPAGPAPAVDAALPVADAAQAAALLDRALTERWGDFAVTLNASELTCAAADMRRLSGRRAVADPASLRHVCEALLGGAADASVAQLRDFIATESGAALAAQVLVLPDGGTGHAPAPACPGSPRRAKHVEEGEPPSPASRATGPAEQPPGGQPCFS
jgi:hypothetical protein